MYMLMIIILLFIFNKFTLELNKVLNLTTYNFNGIQLNDLSQTVKIYTFYYFKFTTLTFTGLNYSAQTRNQEGFIFYYQQSNFIVVPAQGSNIGKFYEFFNIYQLNTSSSV